MFDQNITSIIETIWFLLVNTTWKWQKLKNYWKKRKKNFLEFFPIWRHPIKGVVQSSPKAYFQKRWFLLANAAWKWQKVKNYWKNAKKIINFRDFSWYDIIQERTWFRVFLTPIFKNFLEQLWSSQKIRLWKFQVNHPHHRPKLLEENCNYSDF